jgi:hypothetical protein
LTAQEGLALIPVSSAPISTGPASTAGAGEFFNSFSNYYKVYLSITHISRFFHL